MDMPDDYEYIDHLGDTGASTVYKARHRPSDDIVALKVVMPGTRREKRMAREIRALKSLDNPHAIPILDAAPDGAWYTMPLAEGTLTTLAEGLSAGERERLALEVLEAVASALKEFNAEGQVHRDLKPDNILFLRDEAFPEGRWVVADFGIARGVPGTTTQQLTEHGWRTGTPGYAAPECEYDAHSATPASDVYSMGAVLSWLLTGERPRNRVTLPEHALRSVIHRATREKPGQRYLSLEEMLDAARQVVPQIPTTARGQIAALIDNPYPDMAELSALLHANLDDSAILVHQVPKINTSGRFKWYKEDSDSISDVTTALCDALGSEEGRNGLKYAALRLPLGWAFEVLQLAVTRNNLDLAERLAVHFFDALEACDQWNINDDVFAWLASLGERAGGRMLSAILASDASEYVRDRMPNAPYMQSEPLRNWV